jgi:phospholipid/cholesterol/gamma-HCH transport system ATP-binding protein
MSEPLVACRNVSVGYDGKPVLEGINLEIEEGEVVVLLGGSGCGKSTLLRSLTGLLPPIEGEILLLGQSLYELTLEERNQLLRRTGTAFQQDALFGSMSVAENIALPLKELTNLPEPVIKEMVRMRLAMVGLPGMEKKLPTSMSGGQRKRAALARASILDPKVMFCDEPSAGLDPAVAATIDETLLHLRSALGITVIVVTHELESIRTIADRAVMFGRGSIMANGKIEELMENKDPDVFNFFHRVAEKPDAAGALGQITR